MTLNRLWKDIWKPWILKLLACGGLICFFLASSSSLNGQIPHWRKKHLKAKVTRWVVLDSVNLLGLQRTKDFAVRREMTIRVGDSLPLRELDSIISWNQQLIYNTGLFNRVDIQSRLDTASGRLYLSIRMKERWYILPDFQFAFDNVTIAEWVRRPDLRRVSLSPGFYWNNLTGRNDQLFVTVSIGNTVGATVRYRRPFLLPKARLDATFYAEGYQSFEVIYGAQEGKVSRLRYRSATVLEQYLFEFSFTRRFTQFHKLSFGFGYRYLAIGETLRKIAPDYLTTGTRIDHYPKLLIRYDHDRRDIRAFPLMGYRVFLNLEHFGLPGIRTALFTRFIGSFTYFHDIGTSRWNISMGAYAGLIGGDRVPYIEKIWLNRDIVIRGYEAYWITASMVLALKTELKFAIFKRKIVSIKWFPRKFRDFPIGLYLYAWGDAGYANDWTFGKHDVAFLHQALSAYGLGVVVPMIYDTIVRFEVGRNTLGRFSFQLNFTVAIQ
jgi:outer membrane protein assembly factor BamA